jgi:hypothetical protein
MLEYLAKPNFMVLFAKHLTKAKAIFFYLNCTLYNKLERLSRSCLSDERKNTDQSRAQKDRIAFLKKLVGKYMHLTNAPAYCLKIQIRFRKFLNPVSRAQCYKTSYICNLLMFLISWRVLAS